MGDLTDSFVREVFGYRFTVMKPSPAVRVFGRVMDAIRTPTNLLSLRDGLWMRRSGPSPFVARVTNPHGKWRSIDVTDTADEAVDACVRAADNLERLGIAAWSETMRGRIPASFFT